MYRKIIGILICIMLIIVPVLLVTGTINNAKTRLESNDDFNVLKEEIKYRSFFQGNWSEEDKILASDGAEVDWFGASVSVDGDTVVIGSYLDDDNGDRSGSAYVFRRSGISWSEEEKLLASDGAKLEYFGVSVCIDGDTAIIGAFGDNDNGYQSGSAYVFRRSGTIWSEEAKLLASDGAADDYFGWSVSIDGDTAIIGARMDDDNGYRSGSAYVFRRSGTIWSEEAKLLTSDGAAIDQFGISVSIDGEYGVIGAYGDNDSQGSAYVFKRSGTTWSEEAKLVASDAGPDWFGWSVSIDGDYVIIGARRNWSNGPDSGSAYVFRRNGTTWFEEAKLLASDGAVGDYFGFSVSINGNYALIGTPCDDDNGNDSGSIYVFKRSGTIWSEEAKLLASDGAAEDYFGWSVSINRDTAIIGAYKDDDYGDMSGSAYIFTKESENQPPNIPNIDGPSSGKPGTSYTYTFLSIDSDGDNISYYIIWDDGEITDWTAFQPSGPPGFIESHIWNSESSYTIRCKTKDIYNVESDWGELTVEITINRAVNSPLFHWFLERFPLLERLLALIRVM